MKKRTILRKVFGLIALTAVIGFLATACPEGGGINNNGGNGDNSGNSGNGGNGDNGGNNGNGDNGNNGGGNGNNNANYRIIAYLGRDDDGTSYDLIITEPETASARVASPEGPSYRLVVTPRGETPRVSEGTAARTNGGIGLRSSRGGEAAVTLEDDELDGINGEISYEDGSEETVNKTLTPYNVYIAGILDKKPCYWNGKSRVELPLSDELSISEINFITVVDGDVYVAGSYYDVDGNTVRACYWKNGIRTDLPVSLGYVGGYAVDSNNNVYVTLFDFWANGSLIDCGVCVNGQVITTIGEFLNDNTAYATSITASGSDVYMAGSYIDSQDNNKIKRAYWKNGQRINDLSDGASLGVGYYGSIAVSGNDVYVLGALANSSIITQYCYWKNGTERTNLQTTSSILSVHVYSITVDNNNDVYVAGYDNGMCYWKNGVKTSFADNGYSLKVAIASGGNVYATGGGTGPGYFVNGEFVSFGGTGISTAICVVD